MGLVAVWDAWMNQNVHVWVMIPVLVQVNITRRVLTWDLDPIDVWIVPQDLLVMEKHVQILMR